MKPFKTKSLRNRVLTTTALLLIGLLAATSALNTLIRLSPMRHVDQLAQDYIDRTMTRALYTFAVARGINAVVSAIQGTQIALSPAGIGLTLSVGEILDPVNDLVERFSWIMLASTTSLGLQRVLMDLGSWLGLQWLLTAGMLLFAVSGWRSSWGGRDIRSWAWRACLLALLLRFFIPLCAFISDGIYRRVLESRYTEATQSMDEFSRDIKETARWATPEASEEPASGHLDQMRRIMRDTQGIIDIRSKIEALKDRLNHMTEHTVNLIVIFLFQTIMIPLLILWLLMKLTFNIR
jgi:hypothetical protein